MEVAKASDGQIFLRTAISQNGKQIAAQTFLAKDGRDYLWIINAANDTWSELNAGSWIELSGRNIRWTADSRGLYYIDTQNGVSKIWMQPIDGGEPHQITNFTSDRIFRFDYSPEAGKMALTRGTEMSDVELISDFN